MFWRKYPLLIVAFTALVASGCGRILSADPPAGPDELTAPPQPVVVEGIRTSYADVVEKTSPAVVRILSEGRPNQPSLEQSPFGDEFFRQFPNPRGQRPQLQRGVGSGVVVSADGTILTNAHVIEGADRITVLMADNKTFEAKLVGTDKPSDLAALKIESQNLPYLTLGNSDTVRVGDIVLAIGNPLGIGQSVTSGIISAKGRRTGLSDGSFEDFLQTDAPINRGNSGGALVNLSGELIGINSQILSSPGSGGGNIGIGFSIPSNMAKSVMEQLLKDGRVRRGRLGIGIQNLTEDTARALELESTSGVLVSNVEPGSAADKAGLKRTDIITAINGEKTEDSNVLRNKVAGTLPGTEIRLTILRDGKPQELTAVLDEFDADGVGRGRAPEGDNSPRTQGDSGKLGLSLQPLTPDAARRLNIPEATEGLIVTEVDPGGVAGEAGIGRGDVIMEINRQPVKSVENVQSALSSAGDKPILLLISRGGQTVYLTVKLR
ncbi:MAG TPA: Do family serine endopeptidase [Pyrinomonadaceae bacterium]|nr:Do family serine endopeptidase [Pyrinomonadaceae bacterium]